MPDTDAVEAVADSLEEYGSSRADYRQLSDEQRTTIARRLVIARSSAPSHDTDLWQRDSFRSSMEEKKSRYMYACGNAGLSIDEAQYIWWNCVYDGLEPVYRDGVV